MKYAYAGHETALWPLMARRRSGAEASVAMMLLRTSSMYAGPAWQGLIELYDD